MCTAAWNIQLPRHQQAVIPLDSRTGADDGRYQSELGGVGWGGVVLGGYQASPLLDLPRLYKTK